MTSDIENIALRTFGRRSSSIAAQKHRDIWTGLSKRLPNVVLEDPTQTNRYVGENVTYQEKIFHWNGSGYSEVTDTSQLVDFRGQSAVVNGKLYKRDPLGGFQEVVNDVDVKSAYEANEDTNAFSDRHKQTIGIHLNSLNEMITDPALQVGDVVSTGDGQFWDIFGPGIYTADKLVVIELTGFGGVAVARGPSFAARTEVAAERAVLNYRDGDIVRMGDYFYRVSGEAIGTESATNDLGVDGLVPSGIANPEHYGAAGDGETDDTAAIQSAHDNNTLFEARNSYKITQLKISGNGKLVDFSSAKISCFGASEEAMLEVGDIEGFRASKLFLGNIFLDDTSGEVVKVTGICRGSTFDWRQIYQRNIEKSVFKCHHSDGGGMFDCNINGGFTHGVSSKDHHVPLIDLNCDLGSSMIQGCRFHFGYAYGSTHTTVDGGIPFLTLKGTSPALLSGNTICVCVGEQLNGGAIHLENCIGSDFKVRAFDTGDWAGSMIKSVAGRGNSYDHLRKGGTRVPVNVNGTDIWPYDLDLSDTDAILKVSGVNNGSGLQYVNLYDNRATLIGGDYTQIDGAQNVRISNRLPIILGQASVIGSSGGIRGGTDSGIVSISKSGTGTYEIYLTQELPQNYYPVQVTCVTTSVNDINLTGQVVYDTSDKTHITIVTSDNGVKADKHFNFTIVGG